MKCPRTFQIEITIDDQIQLAGADCIKEECAQWDEERKCCLDRTLVKQVSRLADILIDIRDKIRLY